MIIVGLEGLDETLLNRVIDAGRMPTLARLVEGSAWVPVVFPPPAFAETRWTTLATGMLADRHGVLHPWESIPGTSLAQAVHAGSIATPTLWSSCDDAGIAVGVVGWPCTHGLALRHGWVIAPGFEQSPASGRHVWPLDPDSYAPPDLGSKIRAFRLGAAELDEETIDQFVNGCETAYTGQLRDGIARAVASQATVHALGTYIATVHKPDVMAIRLNLVADVLTAASQLEIAEASGLVDAACTFMDALLAKYLHEAGMAGFVVITTPMPDLPSARGAALIRAPDVVADTLTAPHEATDLMPTLRAILGLPPVVCDGRLMVGSGSQTPAIISESPAPWCSADHDLAPSTQIVDNERRLYRAQVSAYRGHLEAAVTAVERLLSTCPDFAAAKVFLAETLLEMGLTQRCRDVVLSLSEVRTPGMWRDIAIGLLAFHEHRFADALHCFTRLAAAPACPIRSETWAGRACLKLRDTVGAEGFFRRAIERDRRDVMAWEGLARSLVLQLDLTTAAHALRVAVSLAPHIESLASLAAYVREHGAGSALSSADAQAQLDRTPPVSLFPRRADLVGTRSDCAGLAI